jgi:hypothetical protein
VSDNDAEELLPVTAFEKVIKTTIRQAASPVTRQDMWEAYLKITPEFPEPSRASVDPVPGPSCSIYASSAI